MIGYNPQHAKHLTMHFSECSYNIAWVRLNLAIDQLCVMLLMKNNNTTNNTKDLLIYLLTYRSRLIWSTTCALCTFLNIMHFNVTIDEDCMIFKCNIYKVYLKYNSSTLAQSNILYVFSWTSAQLKCINYKISFSSLSTYCTQKKS